LILFPCLWWRIDLCAIDTYGIQGALGLVVHAQGLWSLKHNKSSKEIALVIHKHTLSKLEKDRRRMLCCRRQILLSTLALQSTFQQSKPSSVLAFSRLYNSSTERYLQLKSRIIQTSIVQSSTVTRSSSSNTQQQQLFGRFKISPNQIFHKTELSFALVNLRPLVPGHVLVVSNRVAPLLSDLEDDEYDDLWRLIRVVQKILKQQYKCNAFNVAIQDGEGAGQSVPHVHVHILPRYNVDTEGDEIYNKLENWSPRDGEKRVRPRLDVPDDSDRRDRTEKEMADEAAIYRSLINESL